METRNHILVHFEDFFYTRPTQLNSRKNNFGTLKLMAGQTSDDLKET